MYVYPADPCKECMNAFQSIQRTIAFDSRDWAADSRLAWIYAIVFGWVNDDSWNELYEKFGWDESDRKRAEELHAQWENAKQAKWTSVEDKLPNIDGNYMVWKKQGFYFVDSFKDGKWLTASLCNSIITHWMPLPKPPEGAISFG